jgi:hypothetical protein
LEDLKKFLLKYRWQHLKKRGAELVEKQRTYGMGGGGMHYFKHKLQPPPLKHKNLNNISPYYIDTLPRV